MEVFDSREGNISMAVECHTEFVTFSATARGREGSLPYFLHMRDHESDIIILWT